MLLKQMKQRKYQQRNRRHIKELDNDSTYKRARLMTQPREE